MKKSIIALGLGLAFASSAVLADSSTYIQHNVDTHATEIGANLSLNDVGTSAFIAADDAGWRAVGLGQTVDLDGTNWLGAYYERGLVDTDGISLTENVYLLTAGTEVGGFGLMAGVGHENTNGTNSLGVSEDTETNKVLAGISKSVGDNWQLAYNWTYSSVDTDGTSVGHHLASQQNDSYHVTEHEVVVGYDMGSFTPYAQGTHYDYQKGSENELVLGVAMSF